MAVRAALGASRARLARQLFLESLALAAAGGACGLGLGWLALQRLAALAPPGLLPGPVRLDLGMLGFAALVSLGSVFGVAPALAASRVDLAASLASAARSIGSGRGRRARRLLVVAEMALGFVLLVGAGLMIRTFVAVQHVDPGFRAEEALTFELNLPFARYRGDEERSGFARRLEERLRAPPGVAAAGSISHLPLDDYPNGYSPYGKPGQPRDEQRMADHRAVTPGYFEAVGATLTRGRFLDANDQAAVVVDEKLAAEAWPGEDPIGRSLEHERLVNGDFE